MQRVEETVINLQTLSGSSLNTQIA